MNRFPKNLLLKVLFKPYCSITKLHQTVSRNSYPDNGHMLSSFLYNCIVCTDSDIRFHFYVNYSNYMMLATN